MAPFYWRLMGNIAGIIMIIVMYLFGKEMFKKRKYALIAALLMTFDTFHFAQTRMGTIDSFAGSTPLYIMWPDDASVKVNTARIEMIMSEGYLTNTETTETVETAQK